jgi:DNA-binding PadR family transcriptional regulator
MRELEYICLRGVWALKGDGYPAMIQRKIQSATGWSVRYGTIYRILSSLEKNDMVSSEFATIEAKRGRKTVHVYSITEYGQTMLDNAMTERRRIGFLRGG